MSRGVIYVVWGDALNVPNAGLHSTEIFRSVKSVKTFGYPACLVTAKDTEIDAQTLDMFDKVIRVNFPTELQHMARKTLAYDYTPFDETLYLDTDTEVFESLDFGFEMAERHGLALCFAPPFRLQGNKKEVHRDLICYNAGVLFFNKNYAVQKLIREWQRLCVEYMQTNDQACLCSAIDLQHFNPFVLPHTWNFRGHFGRSIWIHGKIHIWHSRRPAPINIGDWNELANKYNELAYVTGKGDGRLEIIWKRPDVENINYGKYEFPVETV